MFYIWIVNIVYLLEGPNCEKTDKGKASLPNLKGKAHPDLTASQYILGRIYINGEKHRT
jgi:hypothetical protein